MVSDLKTKLATATLLALTLVAISIPVVATVTQYGGEGAIKNCATTIDNSSACTPPPLPSANETAAGSDSAANDGCTLQDTNATSNDTCGGSLTTGAADTEYAQALRSCNSDAAADNCVSPSAGACNTTSGKHGVCNGSKICNGSKTHNICNGSKCTAKK